jgi:hypothetical protein
MTDPSDGAISAEMEPLHLQDAPLYIRLQDGVVMRLAPGPAGKGLSITVVQQPRAGPRKQPQERGKRGRKPRTGTLALRERLRSDHAAGQLAKGRDYVQWLQRQDAGIGLPLAKTIVYREMKKFT